MNLKNLNPYLSPRERNLIAQHAVQRSQITSYTLNDLLREYTILRQILSDVLNRYVPLSEGERHVLSSLIDATMELGALEYSKAEQSSIKSALELAEKSNQDLEQFASIIAHDFKSPLATLYGFTDLLQEETQNAHSKEIDDTIHSMKKAIHRATELIDGLLNYSRIGSRKPLFQSLSMNDVVRAALENLQSEISVRAAQITCALLPEVFGSFFFFF
ncbi:MAG: histidine kinase dimerization/phospho-acceptor domain-containing protein [Pseudobdellovibrionaceae bacterium]